MLASIFKSVLIMSAAGGALGLLLVCLRPVTEKIFGARWQYYIYLAVLIAMLLPISISLPRKAAALPEGALFEDTVHEEVQSDNFAGASPLAEYGEKSADAKTLIEYLSVIWLLGAAAALSIQEAKYIVFLKTLSKNSVKEENISNIPPRLSVRRTPLLDAPLIIGVFQPTLYLPAGNLSEKDTNYVLMHELTHYYRHDILYKRLAAFVKCVHWFNPVIYAVVRQIDEECEISCDAEISEKFSEAEKRDYMSMILDMVSRSKDVRRPFTTQMASGKKNLKRRFCMMKYSKKKSKITAAAAAAAALLLSATVFASGVVSGTVTGGAQLIKNSEAPSGEAPSGEAPSGETPSEREEMSFSAPLEGEITQMFSEAHPAIDIAAEAGESVRAAADGTVTETGFSAELGNYVIIEHERGFVTEYCCGKEILVKEGQSVERGDVIMTAGNTGKSTGNHLHFAIRENGEAVNPENFFYLKKAEPKIFSENSAFLKERIDDAMKQIYAPNSPVPYSSKVISHTYDGVKGMASFYVEIKTEGDDSNNYLTINFIKGSDGWMTDEYYLEK